MARLWPRRGCLFFRAAAYLGLELDLGIQLSQHRTLQEWMINSGYIAIVERHSTLHQGLASTIGLQALTNSCAIDLSFRAPFNMKVCWFYAV